MLFGAPPLQRPPCARSFWWWWWWFWGGGGGALHTKTSVTGQIKALLDKTADKDKSECSQDMQGGISGALKMSGRTAWDMSQLERESERERERERESESFFAECSNMKMCGVCGFM